MSESTQQLRPSLWSHASAVAAKTPTSRNRVVDFLRAFSILAVISGHWLMAAPYVAADGLALGNMLESTPWTQWLTWMFQVMPIFFLVGGYSNAVSWKAALRDGKPYGEWLNSRLQRLIGPVLPLIFAWIMLAALGGQLGIPAEAVRVGSQVALVPIWFLAVYTLVVLLVPITYAAWQRLGLGSIVVLAVAAALDDTLFFAADLRGAGWLNYAFIWLAVHQLGYAWFSDRFGGTRTRVLVGLCGLALLVALTKVGPHPLSMISVPGEAVSNSLPPKLPMLALGIAQSGLLLACERPLSAWLARRAPWTATVLLNGMIMSIYLWHLTAAAALIGVAILAGNFGLSPEPGTSIWWLTRPLWLAAYLVALMVLVLFVGRYERGNPSQRAPRAWRQVIGAMLVCAGLALIALNGVGGDGLLNLQSSPLLLPFAGAVIAGILTFDLPWHPRDNTGRSGTGNR